MAIIIATTALNQWMSRNDFKQISKCLLSAIFRRRANQGKFYDMKAIRADCNMPRCRHEMDSQITVTEYSK